MAWHKESRRHALAAKGIKTTTKPIHRISEFTGPSGKTMIRDVQPDGKIAIYPKNCSCGNKLKKEGKGMGCEMCGAYYEDGKMQKTIVGPEDMRESIKRKSKKKYPSILTDEEILDELEANGFIDEEQKEMGINELLNTGLLDPETLDEVVEGLKK